MLLQGRFGDGAEPVAALTNTRRMALMRNARSIELAERAVIGSYPNIGYKLPSSTHNMYRKKLPWYAK